MKIDENTSSVTFATGRTLYAHRGLLSLDAQGRMFDGYDGKIEDPEPFTIDERRELATLMVSRWLAWAESGSPAPDEW